MKETDQFFVLQISNTLIDHQRIRLCDIQFSRLCGKGVPTSTFKEFINLKFCLIVVRHCSRVFLGGAES